MSICLASCESTTKVDRALGKVIITELAPEAMAVLADERQLHRKFLRAVASRVTPGFEVEGAKRAEDMQKALHLLKKPGKYAVPGLMSATMSTLFAADVEGVVFATQYREPHWSLERKLDVASAIQKAMLLRVVGEGGDFVGFVETIPIKVGNTLRGYIGGLTPLPRIAGRIARELTLKRSDYVSAGGTVWASLLYEGENYDDRNHPQLAAARLPAAERARRYATSPGGFVHAVRVYRKRVAIGYIPLPKLAEGMELALFYGERETP